MLRQITYLLVIISLLITTASAAVTELEILPDDPAVGDTITIRGIASPDESINAVVSYTKTITPSDGYYRYNINGVEIPQGSNSFTVKAKGVEDLYVGVKFLIWWYRSSTASGGIATISQTNMPPGTYNIQMYGLPADGVSTVTLEITASKTITADENGNYEYSYSTNALPAGDFNVKVGGMTRTLTLKARSSNSEDGVSSGSSDEAPENILMSENKREYCTIDTAVSYAFDLEGNVIRYINFTSLTSSGPVEARVEILKGTSTLVDHAPPYMVYKNLNIWVGFFGWATPKNIADPIINFQVERSWVNENHIDECSIRLNRYNEGQWDPLVTDKIYEDTEYLYFEAETPGFSPFAITGQTNQSGELQSAGTTVPPEHSGIVSGVNAISGFEILMGIIGLLIAFYVNKK